MKDLIKQYIKVYSNCRTKYGYIGDGVIIKVIRNISGDLYNCDIIFDDEEISTYTIDVNDLLYQEVI